MAESYQIVIVGAGGFGREVLPLIADSLDPQRYEIKGYLGQDDAGLRGYDIPGRWLGDPEQYEPQPQDRFILAIGNMHARKRVVESLVGRGGEFVSLVHPRAYVAPTAKLGKGVVIYPFACVSNCATVGDYAHLSIYASLGHDCVTGKYCLMAPYATTNGFVQLGDEVYLSTHSTVVPGCQVGARTIVSANSAVMRSVAENCFVFGVPGKVIPRFVS